ncbi:MAG: alpha/beta fold hydrolase, partial [Notoacmeibacter sp.]|nr:alpha/beta fold hydrolase [Notoacmeibacter sp.]
DFSGRIQPGKDVMVFIHGYRNNFADALFRITQIVHDTGFTGTAVLFSWASRGSTVEYIYDRDSATAARDSLESTLRALGAARPNRIDVIAHSMGSWVTMEAMRQLKIGGDADLGGRLGDVILASPDISADVFKAQMARYGTPARPFFILMSRDDKALRLSQFIAGNKPRLGDYSDTEDLAKLGVIVVDLTSVGNADRLNHTKFAQNPALVRLLGERLRQGENFNPQRVSAEDGLLTLTAGVGAAVTGTARVIITTPRKVFSTAVPQ